MNPYTLRYAQTDGENIAVVLMADDEACPRVVVTPEDISKKDMATVRAGLEVLKAAAALKLNTPPEVIAARLDAAIAAKKAEHDALDKALAAKRKAVEAK